MQKLKVALFRILSQEGTNVLKIPEIAQHVQSCDLNDLPSGNALEALVCSSLSSGISLFERISSSTFRLRTNFIHSRERNSTQVDLKPCHHHWVHYKGVVRTSSKKIMEFGEYQRGNSISKNILPNAEAAFLIPTFISRQILLQSFI